MVRRRSKTLATLTLLAFGAIAVWLLFVDSRASREDSTGLRSQHDGLPRLAHGPALSAAPEVEVEVRLSGVIRDTASEPIAGAYVCAACTDCNLGFNRADRSCTRTDTRGVYALSDLPQGDYKLTAGAAGYVPGILYGGAVLHIGPDGLRAEDVDGVLVRGGALVTGVVLDGTGGPIAGAFVEAYYFPGGTFQGVPLLQATTSGDDGAFSISVPRGGVQLMSRAEGYAPGNLATTAPATGVRLMMTPAAEIAGYVVTAKDGKPVANVRVIAKPTRHATPQFAISDDLGAFRLRNLDPGTFHLSAESKGWFGQHSGSVTLEIAERAADVLVHVTPATTVEGVVLTGERPCTTGYAQLRPPPGEALPSFSARTDAEGRVKFESVVTGVYESGAGCTGFEPQPGPRVVVGTDAVGGIEWRFEHSAEVTIVAKTSGAMIAQATWIDFERVVEQPTAAPVLRGGWTDAEGKAHFKGVPLGPHRIGGPDITQPIPVEVREGENRFEVEIDARGYIDVHVTRPNGEPNDDVGMFAMRVDEKGVPGDAHRYDTGRYRIGPLTVGPHYVRIRDGVNPGARAVEEVNVRAGAVAELAMVYGGGDGKIFGRVLDAAGMPLANAWVSAEAADSASDMLTQSLAHESRARQRRTYTDAEGRFEISDLDSRGQFSVVVTRRGGGEERRTGVAPGQHVEVQLPAAATLEGVALAADGTPLRNFRLSLVSAATRQNIAPIFGPEANGAWQLQDVAAGEVTLRVMTTNGEQGSTVVTVAPGQKRSGIVLKIAPVQAAMLAPAETDTTAPRP